MSSGGGGGTTVTQQSGPPPQVLQAYQNLVAASGNQAQQPLNLYTGPMVAGFTPQQQAGFQTIDAAQGIGAPYINAAAQEFGTATQPLWPSLPQVDTNTLKNDAAANWDFQNQQLGHAQGFGDQAAGTAERTPTWQSGAQSWGTQGGNLGAQAAGIAQEASPFASFAGGQASNVAGTAAGIPGAVAPYQGGATGAAGIGAGTALGYAGGVGATAAGLPGSVAPYQASATRGINLPGYDQLSTYFNPYQQAVTQATQRLFDQQNAQQLEQVRGNATSQNAYGGDREAVAEALTAQQQQLAQAPVLAGIQQQGFAQAQQELNTEQQIEQQRQATERQLALGAGQLGLGAGTSSGQLLASAGQLGIGAGQLGANTYLGAGNLGLGGQQAAVQGGIGAGQLGLGAGQLKLGQAGATTQAAQPEIQAGQLNLGAGQLGLGEANAYLGAGQLNMGIAAQRGQQAQQQFGEFNTQQAQQLAAEQANAWLASQAGFGLASLGTQAQNQALTGAQAELGAGGMQQQLAQEQLNIPYQQFEATQAYPYQQLSFLAPIVEGTGSLSGGRSSTTSPGPSPISQLGGLASAATGLSGLFSGGGSDYVGSAAGGNPDLGQYDTSGFFQKRGGRIGFAQGGQPGQIGNAGQPGALGGIGAKVPDVNIDYIPTESGQPVASRVGLGTGDLFQSQQSSSSSGGGGGGFGDVLGGIKTAASIGSAVADIGGGFGIGDVIGGLFALKTGGRPGFDDGGATQNSTPLAPGQIPNPRSASAYTVPAVPKVDINHIIHPGPAVKIGAGPPQPPGAAKPPAGIGADAKGLTDALSKMEKSFGGGDSASSDTATADDSAAAAHGGRIGLATGGYGGATASEGVPLGVAISYGGAGPNIQGAYQQLQQLPLERLREMQIQFPPNTQQGMLVQRAIASKEATVGAGTAPANAPALSTPGGLGGQSAQPAPTAGAAGGAATLGEQPQDYGGTSHLAEGGEADKRGYVTEDELDPHPVVDHSGKTVMIKYPSEGKTLDLGLPPIREGERYAAGGSVGPTGAAAGVAEFGPYIPGGPGGADFGVGSMRAPNGIDLPVLTPQNSGSIYARAGNVPSNPDIQPGGGLGNWNVPLPQITQFGNGPGGTTMFPSSQAYMPNFGASIISGLTGKSFDTANNPGMAWAGGISTPGAPPSSSTDNSGVDATLAQFAALGFGTLQGSGGNKAGGRIARADGGSIGDPYPQGDFRGMAGDFVGGSLPDELVGERPHGNMAIDQGIHPARRDLGRSGFDQTIGPPTKPDFPSSKAFPLTQGRIYPFGMRAPFEGDPNAKEMNRGGRLHFDEGGEADTPVAEAPIPPPPDDSARNQDVAPGEPEVPAPRQAPAPKAAAADDMDVPEAAPAHAAPPSGSMRSHGRGREPVTHGPPHTPPDDIGRASGLFDREPGNFEPFGPPSKTQPIVPDTEVTGGIGGRAKRVGPLDDIPSIPETPFAGGVAGSTRGSTEMVNPETNLSLVDQAKAPPVPQSPVQEAMAPPDAEVDIPFGQRPMDRVDINRALNDPAYRQQIMPDIQSPGARPPVPPAQSLTDTFWNPDYKRWAEENAYPIARDFATTGIGAAKEAYDLATTPSSPEDEAIARGVPVEQVRAERRQKAAQTAAVEPTFPQTMPPAGLGRSAQPAPVPEATAAVPPAPTIPEIKQPPAPQRDDKRLEQIVGAKPPVKPAARPAVAAQPTLAAQPAAATPAATGPARWAPAIGDSLGWGVNANNPELKGNGLQGSPQEMNAGRREFKQGEYAVWGATPQQIAEQLPNMKDLAQWKGRSMPVSLGWSNALQNNGGRLTQQDVDASHYTLQYLKGLGINPVVMGVSEGAFPGANAKLEKLAKDDGVAWGGPAVGLTKAGNIHPTAKGYQDWYANMQRAPGAAPQETLTPPAETQQAAAPAAQPAAPPRFEYKGELAPGFKRENSGSLTYHGKPPDVMLPGGIPGWRVEQPQQQRQPAPQQPTAQPAAMQGPSPEMQKWQQGHALVTSAAQRYRELTQGGDLNADTRTISQWMQQHQGRIPGGSDFAPVIGSLPMDLGLRLQKIYNDKGDITDPGLKQALEGAEKIYGKMPIDQLIQKASQPAPAQAPQAQPALMTGTGAPVSPQRLAAGQIEPGRAPQEQVMTPDGRVAALPPNARPWDEQRAIAAQHPRQGGGMRYTEAEPGMSQIGAGEPSVGSGLSSRYLSMGQMKQLLIDAGMPPEKAPIGAAIMMAESRGDIFAANEKGEHSYGLSQINADAWGPGARAALGNPAEAAKWMVKISKGGQDFHDWSTFKNGDYERYMGEARAARGQPVDLSRLPSAGGGEGGPDTLIGPEGGGPGAQPTGNDYHVGPNGQPVLTPQGQQKASAIARDQLAKAPAHERSALQRWMASPSYLLFLIGAGMLASRSPFPGVALGEGLQFAAKGLQAQAGNETREQLAEARLGSAADKIAIARDRLADAERNAADRNTIQILKLDQAQKAKDFDMQLKSANFARLQDQFNYIQQQRATFHEDDKRIKEADEKLKEIRAKLDAARVDLTKPLVTTGANGESIIYKPIQKQDGSYGYDYDHPMTTGKGQGMTDVQRENEIRQYTNTIMQNQPGTDFQTAAKQAEDYVNKKYPRNGGATAPAGGPPTFDPNQPATTYQP